jgi:osmotically inducible lipoprotein OsmB
MNAKFIGAVVTAAALLGLGGCAGMDARDTNTVGGAVVGGVVGGAVGGTTGAVVGAGAGAVIGNQMTPRRY